MLDVIVPNWPVSSYLGHGLTDNLHGLAVDIRAGPFERSGQRDMAAQMPADVVKPGKRVPVGSDKADGTRGFVKACREHRANSGRIGTTVGLYELAESKMVGTRVHRGYSNGLLQAGRLPGASRPALRRQCSSRIKTPTPSCGPHPTNFADRTAPAGIQTARDSGFGRAGIERLRRWGRSG